jgi:hypothetical protein
MMKAVGDIETFIPIYQTTLCQEEYHLLGYNAACHLISHRFLAQLFFSTLKIEAICSSETSVDTQRTTRRYILEDGTLHNHHCENLKSRTMEPSRVITKVNAERNSVSG